MRSFELCFVVKINPVNIAFLSTAKNVPILTTLEQPLLENKSLLPHLIEDHLDVFISLG